MSTCLTCIWRVDGAISHETHNVVVDLLPCFLAGQILQPLAEPEALYLHIPEMQVVHGHNDLLFEEAVHMHLAMLTHTCKTQQFLQSQQFATVCKCEHWTAPAPY